MRKPKVLVFILNYLPGYNAGGVVRTVVNTVDWLNDDYEFWIVTRDRDLGSHEPYSDIKIDEWQYVEGAMVRYLPPYARTTRHFFKLIADTPHDIIHLNSFFDPLFTIRIMLARRMGLLPLKPLILSPRGEFGEGSLKIRYAKKILFIHLSKLLRLYNNVIWHASSEYELADLIKVMKFDAGLIKVALDLPCKVIPKVANDVSVPDQSLKIVFLSRLSREKNLDYALRVLKRVKATIIFDIYGPMEDSTYWKECQELIKQLPQNVAASYHGPVPPHKVSEVFSRYDLFFLPTSGENYGHVIAESLSAGTKVLISTNTPWQNLEKEGLGWAVGLGEATVFVKLIEEFASVSGDERVQKRVAVMEIARKRLVDLSGIEDNRALFKVPTSTLNPVTKNK